MSKTAFGREVGISVSSIASYERNDRDPMLVATHKLIIAAQRIGKFALAEKWMIATEADFERWAREETDADQAVKLRGTLAILRYYRLNYLRNRLGGL
jgi:hypothetical protein